MNLAANELTETLRRIPKEQLLRLPPEELARIGYALGDFEYDAIVKRCSQLAIDEVNGQSVAREDAGCLYWLQNLTLTEDDHWLAKGTPEKALFPKQGYFRYLMGAMLRPVASRRAMPAALHPQVPADDDFAHSLRVNRLDVPIPFRDFLGHAGRHKGEGLGIDALRTSAL